MAKILSTSAAFHLLIISSLLSSFSMVFFFGNNDHDEFVKSLDPKLLGLKKEKLTHFRFYWHDVVYSPNPSSVTIVEPPSISKFSSQIRFGLTRMFDNALTETPDPNSKLIARAQGFYGAASQEELSLLMVENFVFVEGKYKGSAITVMGKNSILNQERELSVIGGSGVFRFARGYALLTTHSFIPFENDNAIVEYNIYVLHY